MTRPGASMLLALALGLATFAFYAPALRYQYVMADDVQYTVETPQVTSGLSLANIRWAFTTVHQSWYSPLLWISFMADSSLFGPAAFGYHLTNILLHTLNALLLFWILLRLTRTPLAAAFAAALWALHPLRIESVAWIAERKDVLSGFFFLLAVAAYLRYVERPGSARMAAVALCMACGMLSKTILVVLPPLLMLLDFWPLRRIPFPAAWRDLRGWRPFLAEKALLWMLMAAGIALTLYTHRHAHDLAPPLSLAARLALVAPAYFGHLKQILWPAHLALFYPVSYPAAGPAGLALAALILVSWTAWRWRHVQPAFLIGWLWYLVALAPLIRGIRFDEQSSFPDRYTYLPAIGLALLWAGVMAAFARRSRRHLALAGIVSATLLAAATVRGWRYLPQWESQHVMAPILIRLLPDHPFVNNTYGQLLAAQNKPDEAIPYFRKAEHWNILASCNLATALLHAGRPEEALPLAMEICANPQAPPEAFLALGLCHLQLDQAAAAIPPLQTATQRMPGYPLAWQMLYRARLEAGDAAGAAACVAHLRGLDARDVLDFDGLVRMYTRTWQSGNPRLAWPFFAHNLPRHPRNILLHNNAAWLLATTENPPAPATEAVRLVQAALELAGPDQPSLLDTLAAAQAAQGDFSAAENTAAQALRLLPDAQPEVQALRREIQDRLARYQRREAYREPPPAAANQREIPQCGPKGQ